MTDKRHFALFPYIWFILISLLFSSPLFAGKPIAEVYRVRGKVTQLSPGDLIARRVKKGDKIFVDTSLVTYKKSFVQVAYFNGGSVNIGPNSKAIITQTSKKRKGVIGLLKGSIRSNYRNPSVRKSPDLKFFIKTNTAAMGVRGTDFQVIYNPENTVTNLLTFEGEVSIVRVEPKLREKSARVRKTRRSKKRRVKKNIYGHSVSNREIDLELEEIEFTDKQLEEFIDNSDERVIVGEGQYSAVLPALDRASIPIKISPIQLGILKKNAGLMYKTNKKLLRPIVFESLDFKKFQNNVKQKAPPEGYFNASTGEYAAKSGGFIDLKTGLYIQPSAHSLYNERLGLYIENNLGSIDNETGQYIAPKGLKVDANKGFIPSGRKFAKNKKILAMAKSLNNEIQLDVLADRRTSVKELVESSLFGEQELYSKNILTISYLTGSQTSLTNGLTAIGDATYSSTSRSGYRIMWDIASNSFWRPYTFFENQKIVMDDGGGRPVNNASDKSVEIGAGLKFYSHDRLQYFGQFGFDQHIMLQYKRDAFNTLTSAFDRLTRLKLLGGGEYVFIRSSRYDLRLNSFLAILPKSTKETISMGTTFSFGLKAYFNYWFKRNLRLSAGIEYEKMSMELTFPDATYDHSISQITPMLSLTKVF